MSRFRVDEVCRKAKMGMKKLKDCGCEYGQKSEPRKLSEISEKYWSGAEMGTNHTLVGTGNPVDHPLY